MDPTPLRIGDRVSVQLSNGYKTTGTILRFFKNGSIGIREADKKYYVRVRSHHITIRRIS